MDSNLYTEDSASVSGKASFTELRFQREQFHTESVVPVPEIKLRRFSRLIEWIFNCAKMQSAAGDASQSRNYMQIMCTYLTASEPQRRRRPLERRDYSLLLSLLWIMPLYLLIKANN